MRYAGWSQPVVGMIDSTKAASACLPNGFLMAVVIHMGCEVVRFVGGLSGVDDCLESGLWFVDEESILVGCGEEGNTRLERGGWCLLV